MLKLRQRNCTSPGASRPALLPACTQRCARVLSAGSRYARGKPVCRTGGGATADGVIVAASADTAPTNGAATVSAPVELGAAHAAPADEARRIVDEVLDLIKGTDSGLQISRETRTRVDSLLDRLEELGGAQQPRPLDNPLLWGNYNVAYTSVGRSQERGEPAGGRFRGRIGRALFRTAGLFQSVLQPDIATNKVEFRLFGFLPGHVGLRGRVLPQGERGDTVQVLFEPPVLSVANSLHLRIGQPSSVVLTTTYLDERVRLGKGSRGSLFVFTRGGAADAAAMDQVGLQRTSLTAAAAFSAFFVSLFLGGAALWVSGQVALKAAALCMWLLGAAVGGVVRQGGLLLDREDERMVAAAKAEIERRQQQKQEQGKEKGEERAGEAGGGSAAAGTA
ncbi:hypothetical protein PLESTB_000922200 [Pleodorina starrii]|uniref:Plastid lipid-associated protein/fibrillin conserved domain-containing protein n=1 Tax=Pleodorina starrii TaxID=330485 RepID=A0A9W6BND2_9CHLO|nr:hypothetical protein PLESTM_001533100 [Pleodorina starrii]GLC54935.1 hypothetical protein PLESTB_000922200 [Pleodorina starrii]GLC73618.1 hypothetical protein PLESTF_001400600 [Pleodorina starrii]